eukprot:COSAG05_NODE_710_length_7822_cov_18.425353_8_plen_31_part_00
MNLFMVPVLFEYVVYSTDPDYRILSAVDTQ